MLDKTVTRRISKQQALELRGRVGHEVKVKGLRGLLMYVRRRANSRMDNNVTWFATIRKNEV